MKLEAIISILEQNQDKELLFVYAPDTLVSANYHLTEVKNVQFDTTDCGGSTNFWKETHLQLWENPKEKEKKHFMTAGKILSILKKVDGIKPLMPQTEIKIEYGNDTFATSVMPIENVILKDNQVWVNLFTEATRCKANDSCNISENHVNTDCCEPANSCC